MYMNRKKKLPLNVDMYQKDLQINEAFLDICHFGTKR